jgi:hypothetical protein
MATERFWGLTPSEWTAIGTIALAAVGIATVIVNAFAVRRAGRSAAAAERAAVAAGEAAAAQVASVEVRFEIRVRFAADLGPVQLKWHRPVAVVHGVELAGGFLADSQDVLQPATCEFRSKEKQLPRWIHPGDVWFFEWPHRTPKEQTAIMWFTVTYSLSPDGQTFTRELIADEIVWG